MHKLYLGRSAERIKAVDRSRETTPAQRKLWIAWGLGLGPGCFVKVVFEDGVRQSIPQEWVLEVMATQGALDDALHLDSPGRAAP